MQRVALRDVDLASFRAAIGPEGCADGTIAAQRGAVVQMAWEASQQLLTGTVREGAGEIRGGEIRTVSASFRASPGFPLRFREGYCSCAKGSNCVHVAALVLAATDETLGAAPRRPAPPPAGRAALGAVARLAARHAAGPRGVRGGRRHRERAARGRAVPGAAHDPSPSATPATPRTTGATSRRPRTPPASSSSRRGWCSPGALAAGWRATCPGPGSTTCCCAMSSPPRTCACCTSCSPSTGPARRSTPVTTTRTPAPATATRSTWTCPPASPASCGPCSSRRTRSACPSSTGASRARCRRRARRSCASTSRRRDHTAHRPGHQDRRQHGRRPAALHRHRGPWRHLRRPGGARRRTASSPGSARPAHPPGARAAAAPHARGRAAGRARGRAGRVPVQVLPAAAPPGDRDVIGRVVHRAGDLGPELVVRADYASGHQVDIRWEWSYQVGGTELRAALGAVRDPFRDQEAEARVLRAVPPRGCAWCATAGVSPWPHRACRGGTTRADWGRTPPAGGHRGITGGNLSSCGAWMP